MLSMLSSIFVETHAPNVWGQYENNMNGNWKILTKVLYCVIHKNIKQKTNVIK